MAAEKELNRLRKLPENRLCPNCRREDKLVGFGAIVVPFKMFVCGECKSAHQAFSHRCKSVSMSNWTMEEVQMLDEKNGGGNRVALQTWLADVPDSARPTPDSRQDELKRFIDLVYNKKAWLSSSPGSRDTERAPSRHEAPSAPPRPVRARSEIAPAVTSNLLDDMLESSPAPSKAPHRAPSVPDMPQKGTSAGSLLDDPLFDFSGSSSPQAAPLPAAAAPLPAASGFGDFDPFALPGSVQSQGTYAPAAPAGPTLPAVQQAPVAPAALPLSQHQAQAPFQAQQQWQQQMQMQQMQQRQQMQQMQMAHMQQMQMQPMQMRQQQQFQQGFGAAQHLQGSAFGPGTWGSSPMSASSGMSPHGTPMGNVAQGAPSGKSVADLFDPFAPVSDSLTVRA